MPKRRGSPKSYLKGPKTYLTLYCTCTSEPILVCILSSLTSVCETSLVLIPHSWILFRIHESYICTAVAHFENEEVPWLVGVSVCTVLWLVCMSFLPLLCKSYEVRSYHLSFGWHFFYIAQITTPNPRKQRMAPIWSTVNVMQ